VTPLFSKPAVKICADNDINTPLFVIGIHVQLANMKLVDVAGRSYVYYIFILTKQPTLLGKLATELFKKITV
jgi:hypothetical protein